MSVGAVPRSTYIAYLKSVGSPLLVVAMLSSYLLSNGAQFFQQYTVAKWTEVGSTAMGSAMGLKYLSTLVYAAGVVSVFLWIRSFLTMKVGVRASEFLHSRMLSSVFAGTCWICHRTGETTDRVAIPFEGHITHILFPLHCISRTSTHEFFRRNTIRTDTVAIR